jgi:hypothetical protein
VKADAKVAVTAVRVVVVEAVVVVDALELVRVVVVVAEEFEIFVPRTPPNPTS